MKMWWNKKKKQIAEIDAEIEQIKGEINRLNALEMKGGGINMAKQERPIVDEDDDDYPEEDEDEVVDEEEEIAQPKANVKLGRPPIKTPQPIQRPVIRREVVQPAKEAQKVELIEVVKETEQAFKLPNGDNMTLQGYLTWIGNKLLEIESKL